VFFFFFVVGGGGGGGGQRDRCVCKVYININFKQIRCGREDIQPVQDRIQIAR